MMKHSCRYYDIFVFLLIMLLNAAAYADDAKAAYNRGVTFFETGKYSESATAFREALKLKPTWKIQYNIGQAEAAARRYGLALDAFETYLVEGGDNVDENRREEVLKEIKSFQYLVGNVEVTATAGDLYIDDEHRATVPLSGVLRVAAGKHHFVLKDGETVLFDKEMRVAGDETTVLYVDEPTSEEGTPAVQEHEETTAPTDNNDSSRISNKLLFGIALGVVGLGVGIGGVPLYLKGRDYFAKAENTQNDRNEYEKWHNAWKRNNSLSIALFVSGGVLLTAGTVLLVLGLKDRKKTTRQAAKFDFKPSLNGVEFTF